MLKITPMMRRRTNKPQTTPIIMERHVPSLVEDLLMDETADFYDEILKDYFAKYSHLFPDYEGRDYKTYLAGKSIKFSLNRKSGRSDDVNQEREHSLVEYNNSGDHYLLLEILCPNNAYNEHFILLPQNYALSKTQDDIDIYWQILHREHMQIHLFLFSLGVFPGRGQEPVQFTEFTEDGNVETIWRRRRAVFNQALREFTY